MKKKYYLLLIALIFVLLSLVSFRTVNVKYLLIGIALLFGGVFSRMDDIDHPSTVHEKRVFAIGTYAWLAFIISGIWLIFHCVSLIIKTGIF